MMAAEEIDAVYRQIVAGNGKQHEMLFSLQGMFLSVMEFDPVTDDPLPITIDDVLHSLATFDAGKNRWQNDRQQHIVSFASSAVRNLIEILHEKNLREHRISRPEKVHEVDSRCMMWLAKKPGFTVKQKIASGQRMMGVYHTTSLDTAENRLFKAFMRKLDDVLIAKEDCCRKLGFAIPDEAERFTSVVHRWLKSDEAEMIGSWGNTPPNNTLLNDKNYRKIWKAHLMLQKLDEQVQYDMNHLEELKNRAFFWLTVARLNLSDSVRFMQDVLFPDYTTLSLLDKNDYIAGYARDKNGSGWERFRVSCGNNSLALSFGEKKAEYSLPNDAETLEDILSCARQACTDFFPTQTFISPPATLCDAKEKHTALPVAAVDLSSVLPPYTLSDGEHGNFSKKLVHQACLIERSKKKTWYPCSSARSKLIRSSSMEARTFSIHSVFDSCLLEVSDSDDNKPLMEKACSDFARIIKDELHCQKCLYVVSDDTDDFSPAVNSFKHSMNSSFSKTEILPRSIAALFTKLPEIHKQFSKNDELTVRAVYDDYEVRTKIRLDFNEELARRNPETKGITFQRLIFRRAERKAADTKKLIPQAMDRILTTQDASLLQGSFSVNAFHFETKPSIPSVSPLDNEIVIRAGDDMSSGAVEYERLQGITPDIALWSDFLPKLSMEDSTGKKYVLVEPEKVSIRPIVGKPVQIPIAWKFSFPAGKEFYEFPLVQGDKTNKAKYFAFIKDASFPLEHETKCSLYLTYTYGMPLPYSLEFIAVSSSAEFKSVAVSWENTSHKDYIHDMPVPNFVKEYTWADMKCVPNKDNTKTSDMTGVWLPRVYNKIRNAGIYKICKQIHPKTPVEGKDVFLVDKICEDGRNPICYTDTKDNISVGDSVWCCVVKSESEKGGYRALDALLVGKNYDDCSFSKSIRFPTLTVWNNCRSINDADCPRLFREDTLDILDIIKNSFNENTPLIIQQDFYFFLSCLHKDMPDWFFQILPKVLKDIDKKSEYPKWISFALGDCSTDWQKDLLSQTLALLGNKNKAVYAIKILAKASWRVNGFIYNLTAAKAKKLISAICTELSSNKALNSKGQTAVIAACLECIVALCRLRKTRDNAPASEEMLSILSPAKNEEVKKIVNLLSKMKKNETEIKTYLTFHIDRPDDDTTPELLYAAHGYLSGAMDSNAIEVLEADFSE